MSHFFYDKGLPHGQMLDAALGSIVGGYRGLVDLTNALQTMIAGDGSQTAHFVDVAARLGFQGESANADAKAAYEELQSLRFKLETDSSVDHVNAAMFQAFNKFR
jgi:hypothetical protein